MESNKLQEAKEWRQQLSAYEWEKLADKHPSIFSETFEEQVVRIYLSEHPQERTYTVDEAVQWLKDGNAIENDCDKLGLLIKVLRMAHPKVSLISSGGFKYYFTDRVHGYTYDCSDVKPNRPTIKLSQIQSNTVEKGCPFDEPLWDSVMTHQPKSNTVEREENKDASFDVFLDKAPKTYEQYDSLPEKIKGEDVEEAIREKAEEIFDHNFPIRSMVEMAEWQRQQSDKRIKGLEEALDRIKHEIKTKGSDTDLYCMGQMRVVNILTETLSKK